MRKIATYNAGHLTVDVPSDASYFTVYNKDGKPVGTINRPMLYSHDTAWKVYDLDGALVANAIGPRGALFRLYQHTRA